MSANRYPEVVRQRAVAGVASDPPAAKWPDAKVLRGRYMQLEPLSREHNEALYALAQGSEEIDRSWDYMFTGPYTSFKQFADDQERFLSNRTMVFYAIRRLDTNEIGGYAAYMNIVPAFGTIEIGNIWFGLPLQNTPAATEAIYELIRHALDDLEFRRMEWKCNALNMPSRQAALRFGFAFESIFYKHMFIKGRSRDTAWFAIVDDEWPLIRACYEQWLAPENFDAEGRQRESLGTYTQQARAEIARRDAPKG